MANEAEEMISDSDGNILYRHRYMLGTIAAGAVAVPLAVPLGLSAVGFGTVGIAKGSLAAAWMASTAVANGGVVAAGGTIALLQSAGAVGISTATSAVVGGVGAAAVKAIVPGIQGVVTTTVGAIGSAGHATLESVSSAGSYVKTWYSGNPTAADASYPTQCTEDNPCCKSKI